MYYHCCETFISHTDRSKKCTCSNLIKGDEPVFHSVTSRSSDREIYSFISLNKNFFVDLLTRYHVVYFSSSFSDVIFSLGITDVAEYL